MDRDRAVEDLLVVVQLFGPGPPTRELAEHAVEVLVDVPLEPRADHLAHAVGRVELDVHGVPQLKGLVQEALRVPVLRLLVVSSGPGRPSPHSHGTGAGARGGGRPLRDEGWVPAAWLAARRRHEARLHAAPAARPRAEAPTELDDEGAERDRVGGARPG